MLKYLAFLFLFVPTLLQAQTFISGKILDERNKPIDNVTVTYKKTTGMAILGFTKSDANGAFKLEIKVKDIDSVQLDFNHMTYAKRSDVVLSKTASYSYMLKEEARLLDEVKVADIPVFRRKDTINYNVNSFTSKQDRVIADIIKKLPGVEMVGDQILYQGQPIQKYMVNNLHLMEGRYAMINKNLPVAAVKNVQIVENDQPIKILDSLVFSNRASLNIELEKFTSTGTGKIGVGVSPALWDLKLTPMTFGKTFQMLNSFQTNNMGYDASKELRPFYTGGMVSGSNSSVSDGASFISLRNTASPGFDESKWLDNRVFLLSTNVLQQLKNDVQIKGNFSYYNDLRKRKGFTATQFFTADETILTTEAIDNSFRINVFDAGVLIEKNEKTIYLRNAFKYHKRWNKDVGNLLFNDIDRIVQNREYDDQGLLNSLSMTRFIGKQLVSINSVVEWHKTPQHLAVEPGQLADILNKGMPYERMTQQVYFNSFRTDNGLSFMRKINYWRISPSVNINYNRNNLETGIFLSNDGLTEKLGDGYWNDMCTSRLQLSLNTGLGYERNKWKINFTTPYSFLFFNTEQQDVKTLSNVVKHTYNPSLNVTYILNSQNEISANTSTGRRYGELGNFYNSYIISSYRSMQRYNARLLGNDAFGTGIGYSYKNTLKAQFANIRYAYSEGSRDYIFRNAIDAQGQSTVSIEDHRSENNGHSLSGSISRLWAPIKTITKFNASTGISRSDYLLNDLMAKQKNHRYSGQVEIINNSSSFISGEYKTNLNHSTNRLANGVSNTVISNNHYLNLTIFPGDRHSVMINNSYYRNNIDSQKNQYFLDAKYRYRLEKWKTDIEFIAQNLLNNSNYVQQFSNNFQVVESFFELRPRQFMISTGFKF